jgi:hypothetical protein
MKKQLQTLIAVICLLIATNISAQFKLEGTNYIGAMTDAAVSDWTKGWTNFDPKNAVYAAPTDLTTLDGMAATLPTVGKKEITTTLTLDATKVYLLTGLIVVKSGGKLVIPAGTLIRCQADVSTTPNKNFASIIVERGGQIEVLGTATNPVVMTSAKAVGARERGDWGGLVVCGKANHNLWNASTDNVQLEGVKEIAFDGTLGKIGGTVPNDNSGIIRYLRLEFGGIALAVNQEINGLTLGTVGSGTEIRNVQVSFSADDSFEWFGGSVNSKYLVAWKGTDDDFDTDNGYSGLNQFGIGVKDPDYYDLTYTLTSGGSTSEGFESDNELNGNADVTATKGFTNAIFSNYTMLGPIAVGAKYADASAVVKAAFRRGARIRRNSSLRIVNSIFMGYRNFLMVEGDSCLRNTNNTGVLAAFTPALTTVDAKTKQIMFSNNIIVNTTSANTTVGDTTANGLVEVARGATLGGGSAGKLAALDAWVRSTASANKIDPVAYTAGTLLVSPLASSTTPDFRPVAGSPALTGGGFRFVGTPIGDLISDAKEIAAAQVAPIFPNPISNGTINFGRQVAAYGIFDIKGQLIAHGFDTDHASINGFAKGMYFIKLDGKVQKLIVQ